ncbi:MAG: hypothetical protein ACEQSH_00080 [Bacteroidia bacterium]
MAGPYRPTQAGYVAFLRSIGITTAILPDDSVFIPYSYDVALDTVNTGLALLPGRGGTQVVYTMAVYYLATDFLLNWAPDQVGETFFADMRKEFGLLNFQAGVVTSANDVSTGSSLTTPDYFKNLALSQLQNLKTPYGRQYLAWAQTWGTNWGLS